MRSPEEAGAYVRKLRAILRYVGSCDGNMEQGSMRADVNVSVRKPGGELGTRTETKNVNSVRFIMAVIEHEARRQVDLIEEGGSDRPGNPPVRSRQGRDAVAALQGGRARLPLFPRSGPAPARARATPSSPNAARRLPELPDAKRARYESELGLSAYNAAVLTADVTTARWFEALLAATGKSGAEIGKRRLQLGHLRPVRRAQPPRQGHHRKPGHPRPGRRACSPWSPTAPSPARSPSRSSRSCSKPARIPARSSRRAASSRPRDTGAIEAVIAEVMAANADKVAEYRGGKDKLFGFFVGQVMKAMAGKANPGVVNELLKKALG